MHLLLIIAPAFLVGVLAHIEMKQRVKIAYQIGLKEGREEHWKQTQ